MRFSSLIALTFAAVASAAPITTTTSVPTYQTCNRPGVFALTFDDGPFSYSWDLAKYLHSRGIKATFFTNGYNWVTEDLRTATTTTESDGAKTYYDVFKYYQELGHEIASHTYGHVVLKGLSEQEVAYQLNEQSDLIYNATGLRPAFMRPPEGALDETSSRVINSLNYSIISWDLDTLDWQSKNLQAEQALVHEVVEADVHGQTPGHICLQHDVHEQSAKELTPWLIDYVLSKNYTFVTVSECLGIPAYH